MLGFMFAYDVYFLPWVNVNALFSISAFTIFSRSFLDDFLECLPQRLKTDKLESKTLKISVVYPIELAILSNDFGDALGPRFFTASFIVLS